MLPTWVFASAFWIVAASASALAGAVEHDPEARLTLKLQDRPLHQALETVAELAGTKIEVTGHADLDRRVTVTLRHATLQKSLGKILRPRSYVLLWMSESLLRVHVFRARTDGVAVDRNLERRLGEADSVIQLSEADPVIPLAPAEIEPTGLNPPARSPSEIEMLPPPVTELLGEPEVPGSDDVAIILPPSSEIEAMRPAPSPSEIEMLPPPVTELLGEQEVPGSDDVAIIPPPSTEIER